MKTNRTQPQPTREFMKTFGAYRVGGVRETEKLVTEMETKLTEVQGRDRTDRTPEWHAAQDHIINAYTYFVQVARARRAQFFGVRL